MWFFKNQEYLYEFKAKFDAILPALSGAYMELFYEKLETIILVDTVPLNWATIVFQMVLQD